MFHGFMSSVHYTTLSRRDELELGWFGSSWWRKDTSDTEWHVFAKQIRDSAPFLAIHVMGSQFLHKNSPEVRKLFPSWSNIN